MIHPTFQVKEELYIHAAREAVWAHVTRLSHWSQWRSDVAKTAWVQGPRWQEGAQFAIYPTISTTQPQHFIIRMVVQADTTVWESSGGGQTVVYSLQLVDQVGGCKVSLRATFHGWGSLLKRLTSVGEAAKMQAFLTALKTDIERPESRR